MSQGCFVGGFCGEEGGESAGGWGLLVGFDAGFLSFFKNKYSVIQHDG